MNENFNQQNLKNNATKLNFAAVLQHILLDRNWYFLDCGIIEILLYEKPS